MGVLLSGGNWPERILDMMTLCIALALRRRSLFWAREAGSDGHSKAVQCMTRRLCLDWYEVSIRCKERTKIALSIRVLTADSATGIETDEGCFESLS